MTMPVDETLALNAEVCRLVQGHKTLCVHSGCTEPVTHGRLWRTEGMPAAAFAYLCSIHAAAHQATAEEATP